MEETEATPVSVREELERIARTDSDAGSLARILLGGLTDSVTGPDDEIPAAPEPVTEPQTETVVTQTTPVPDADTQEGTTRTAERVPVEPVATGDVPSDPTSPTPPYGGSPEAPNTTPDNRSAEGTAT